MLATSCVSDKLDSYRAGVDIAEQVLAGLDRVPEVVFLFPAIHHQGSAELLEGLYDGLGDDSVIVLGNTGDGYYGSGMASEVGVAGLALHGEGAIRWNLVHSQGLKDDPYGTVSTVMERCHAYDPDLIFFGMDFRTDATQVQQAIQDRAQVPVVGGAAGDHYRMETCFQYAGREALTDAMVALAIGGEDLAFGIHLAHSLKQVGAVGHIDSAEGCTLNQISGQSALDWVYDQLGRPFVEMDMGVVCLTIEADGVTEVRSLMPNSDLENRAVNLYGAISQGSQVRCCVAERPDLLADVQRLSDGLGGQTFDPCAALVVSCAGRKQILGDDIDGEPSAVTGANAGLPMAGYPSFGEFAPLPLEGGGFSRNLFHNMSFVSLTLGTRRR